MLVLPRPVVKAALAAPSAPDLLPTDIGYFPAAANHYFARPNGSSQMIVIICVRGHGWATLGAKKYAVNAGEALVIAPDLPHAYGTDAPGGKEPWTIYWVHVAGRKAPALYRLLSNEGATPVFHCGEDPETLRLFAETFETLQQSYGADNLLLASLTVGRALARLVALHRSRSSKESTADRIEQCVAFMRQRLAAQLSVPELARMANLSNSRFAAAFKRQMGYPALDFFLRLKMQYAAELLDTTSLSVKEIADELGYEDPLYFSRRFRGIHSLSPAQYRATKKG